MGNQHQPFSAILTIGVYAFGELTQNDKLYKIQVARIIYHTTTTKHSGYYMPI